VAKQIVNAAYRVHTGLGPGLLESAYEAVLAFELDQRGLRTVRQQSVPIVYQGTRIEMGFRADLIVEAALSWKSNPSKPSHPCTRNSC
jgi:GxxExxY protein